jgi:hypothetical protein
MIYRLIVWIGARTAIICAGSSAIPRRWYHREAEPPVVVGKEQQHDAHLEGIRREDTGDLDYGKLLDRVCGGKAGLGGSSPTALVSWGGLLRRAA